MNTWIVIQALYAVGVPLLFWNLVGAPGGSTLKRALRSLQLRSRLTQSASGLRRPAPPAEIAD